ncbi:ABC transporter permease [Planctomycetota bacterium]
MQVLKVILRFWATNLSGELAFRWQWISQVFSGIMMTALNLFIFFVIYSHTETIAGWGPWEVVLLVGFTQICHGVLTLFAATGIYDLQNLVDSGGLDGILVRPMNSQVAVSFRSPNIFGMQEIVLGFLTVVFACGKLEFTPSITGIFLSLLCLSAAVTAMYAIWFMSMTITIWFKRLWSWANLIPNFIDFARFPREVFDLRVQLFFRFVIPVILVANVPVEALRGTIVWHELGVVFVTAGALLLASIAFWKYALCHYSSASS